MMKASPFSHRLRTEVPAAAAATTVFRASAGQDKKSHTVINMVKKLRFMTAGVVSASYHFPFSMHFGSRLSGLNGI